MTAGDVARLTVPEFREFSSIPRLSRDMIVTEKIDGTNAQVTVLDDGRVLAGSRNRWLTLEQDNFGFARWVQEHADELRAGLGVGSHYGEWWGAGIQRRYGLDHKRFSLFNVGRWNSEFNALGHEQADPPRSTVCVECPACHVVPVLCRWTFDTAKVDAVLDALRVAGSAAAPGFANPEGVVVFHTKGNLMFKKTLDKNDGHKGNG